MHFKTLKLLTVFCLYPFFQFANAHDNDEQVTYLANEGIMVTSAGNKVLFDPFFHNDYNNYQLVPEDILTAIMNNQAPYNNISAIFVSHAHGDHFAADDMVDYLKKNRSTKLVAPDQAIDAMKELAGFSLIKSQITPIGLSYGDQPINFTIDNLIVDALRVPHAGWPGRADVSNIVYRVSVAGVEPNEENTIIHMGDADPNDDHFRPYKELWQLKETQIAFPPYWFFLSAEGRDILDTRINALKSIGVHVPVNVPQNLKDSGRDYFSKPTETRHLKQAHNHENRE
jgi:L-ascorbate metabolism protein UlaG (beta-lactamase superfamily)